MLMIINLYFPGHNVTGGPTTPPLIIWQLCDCHDHLPLLLPPSLPLSLSLSLSPHSFLLPTAAPVQSSNFWGEYFFSQLKGQQTERQKVIEWKFDKLSPAESNCYVTAYRGSGTECFNVGRVALSLIIVTQLSLWLTDWRSLSSLPELHPSLPLALSFHLSRYKFASRH